MDKREEKKESVEPPRPSWNEWYNKTWEQLTKDIGQLELLSETKLAGTHPSWTLGAYQSIRALIDIVYGEHQAIAKLEKSMDRVITSLAAINEWMKIHQPILDEAKKDYEDKLRRVSEPDR